MRTPDASLSTRPTAPVLVWDLPTRLVHWLLVAAFCGAYLVSEGDRWRGLHALFGYTAGGLVAFRLLWGLLGTRYARFGSFVLAPAAVRAYLRSLLAGRPEHHVGHNPAGSWAVLALLGLVGATALSGWATLNAVGPRWLDEVHELIANATVALVAVHVAAVIVSSLLHRENLVRAMVTGSKAVPVAAAAAGPRRVVALLVAIVVVAFWGGWIPAPGVARGTGWSGVVTASATAAHAGDRKHHGSRQHGD